MKNPKWAFLSVLLVAAALRLGGIGRASFFHYDEGEIAKSAMGPALALRWMVRSAWNGEAWTKESLRAEYERRGFPFARTSARPGYLALSVASMALFGVRDLAMILMSAGLGVATVAFLFLTLRAVWPQGPLAFWGTLFLAVSPNHVFFSRTGFAHVAAGFFLVLAAYLYARRVVRDRPVPAFRVGIAAGCAFTCHFNVAWVLAGLALADALGDPGGGGAPILRRWLSRAARLGLGFAVPLLCFQIVTLALQQGLPGLLPDLKTYFQDLQGQREHLLRYCNPNAVSAAGFYPIHWIRSEGILSVLGIVAGLFFAFRGMFHPDMASRGLAAAALALVVPLVSISLMNWKVARTLVPLFPFAAVLWASSVALWRPLSGAGRMAKMLFVVGSLAPQVAASASYLEGHGHFREIVGRLQAEGAQAFAVDEIPTVDFYASRSQQTMVHSWREYEEIRRGSGRPGVLVALWKDGEYGYQDPVYWNRYGFVREAVDRCPAPRRLPFRVPLDYEFVDREFSWRRIRSLQGLRYEVHLFDLEGLR